MAGVALVLVGLTCSRCGGIRDRPGQRYCQDCHNAYMREWREARGGYAALSVEEKRKDIARSYLNSYVQRRKVRRETFCSRCRSRVNIEGHHHRGYDDPLDVIWLCRVCHKAAHRGSYT